MCDLPDVTLIAAGRRPESRHTVCALVLAWGLVASTLAVGAEAEGERSREKMAKKLDSIMIPKIEFEETSIKNAVDYLIAQSREADPTRAGVNILLVLDREKRDGETAPAPAITLNLNLRDVSLRQAIRFVAEVAHLDYKVEADAVLIGAVAGRAKRSLETRTFNVAPGTFRPEADPDRGGQFERSK